MHVFWLFGAYASGILLASVQKSPADPLLCIPGMLLFIAWVLFRKSVWGILPAIGAFMLLGFVWASQAQLPPRSNDHISGFVDGEPCVIEGTMQHLASYSDGRSRFDFDVTKILRGTSSAKASGLVRVSVRQGVIRAVEGQTLRLRSRLRVPRNFGSPGEFDYVGHLAASKIFVTAHLADAAQIVPLVETSRRQAPLLAGFRHRVAARISQAVPDSEAGLVQALVIGMRDGVTPEQRQILSEGGVAHLFAISGLHFGLLGLLLYIGCRWLYCRSTQLLLWCPPRRIIPLLLILPMAGYLFLTGNGLPTRRAFYMTTTASLLYSSNRRTPPMQLLTTAALAILLIEPLALFQPAFQLSFAGLFGILLWLPNWQKPLNNTSPWLRWPTLLVLTTLAATLATAPLTLWHFHVLAPAGLLTNLAATPIIAWGAVPAGLFGVILTSAAPQLADICFAGAGALVALAMQIVDWLVKLPGLTAIHYFPSHCDLLALLVFLAILAVRGWQTSRWLLRLVLLAAGLVLIQPATGEDPTMRVVALSVGQGDATLLSLGNEQHYLIDGGGLPRSSFDTGERLVAPALGRLQVRRLKGVLLTHDHPDHRDGLRFILNHFPVEKFYCGQTLEELDRELHDAIIRRNIPIETLEQGWTRLDSGNDVRVSIFTPQQDHRDKNERSIAVYARLGGDGVLLTGDMGPDSLQQLNIAGLPGPTTLLKLPHHGSLRSLPSVYLPIIKPRLAFVSSGRNNPHHLPHPETVRHCEAGAVPLYRTDLQGSLDFISAGRGWSAAPVETIGLFH